MSFLTMRESLVVPTQERVRLDIHQRVAPSEPLTQSRHHPASGSAGPSRPDLPLPEEGQLFRRKRFSATNAARGRAARATNRTKSTATNDNVRRQCATAKKLTELDMDRPGSHVTKRYRLAITGSDGIFADYRYLPNPQLSAALSGQPLNAAKLLRWSMGA
jgi:hypothetical protein